MNENQEIQTVKEQTALPEAKTTGTASVFNNFMYVLFAFASLALLVVAEIILNFRPNNTNVIRGIMSIPIYILPVVGMALSFLQTKGKKPSFDFWLNVGALIVALRFL